MCTHFNSKQGLNKTSTKQSHLLGIVYFPLTKEVKHKTHSIPTLSSNLNLSCV